MDKLTRRQIPAAVKDRKDFVNSTGSLRGKTLADKHNLHTLKGKKVRARYIPMVAASELSSDDSVRMGDVVGKVKVNDDGSVRISPATGGKSANIPANLAGVKLEFIPPALPETPGAVFQAFVPKGGQRHYRTFVTVRNGNVFHYFALEPIGGRNKFRSHEIFRENDSEYTCSSVMVTVQDK